MDETLTIRKMKQMETQLRDTRVTPTRFSVRRWILFRERTYEEYWICITSKENFEAVQQEMRKNVFMKCRQFGMTSNTTAFVDIYSTDNNIIAKSLNQPFITVGNIVLIKM